jgi:hypothetical protein
VLVASLVNAGAVVVRDASAPPLGVALVVVVEDEGVVPCVVVCVVAVAGEAALDTEAVFVPPEPHPQIAIAPAPTSGSSALRVSLNAFILAFIFVLSSFHPRDQGFISHC